MEIFINIVLTIVVLNLLIFLHELGHFIAAKIMKVRVDEFALGMGPKVIGKEFRGVLYAIRMLPIGGFVRIYGEGDEPGKSYTALKKDPSSFQSKKLWQKIVILFAGVFMNLMTAVVIYYAFLGMSGFRFPFPAAELGITPPFGEAQVEKLGDLSYSELIEDGAAEEAGWPESGYIIAVGDGHDMSPIEYDFEFREVIADNAGEEIVVEICESIEEDDSCELYPTLVSDEGRVGILLGFNSLQYIQYYGLEVYLGGFVHSINVIYVSIAQMGKIFSQSAATGDYSTALNVVSGPLGLYYVIDFIKGLGWMGVLDLIANLSLTLFVINLLPIPALDGGRIVLAVAESTMGRYFSKRVEAWLIRISFVMMMLLMLAIILKDIIYIENLQNLFG
ncbi:MAG: M50 family metallopeptidase [Candidatus Dojkabacteria bacterium]|nr:MAG: M50 family metallopeptidase [Candidatus Dojkabacteria bacterium]